MKHLILKKKESECHIIYCDSQILFFFLYIQICIRILGIGKLLGFFWECALGFCQSIYVVEGSWFSFKEKLFRYILCQIC